MGYPLGFCNRIMVPIPGVLVKHRVPSSLDFKPGSIHLRMSYEKFSIFAESRFFSALPTTDRDVRPVFLDFRSSESSPSSGERRDRSGHERQHRPHPTPKS